MVDLIINFVIYQKRALLFDEIGFAPMILLPFSMDVCAMKSSVVVQSMIVCCDLRSRWKYPSLVLSIKMLPSSWSREQMKCGQKPRSLMNLTSMLIAASFSRSSETFTGYSAVFKCIMVICIIPATKEFVCEKSSEAFSDDK